MFAFNQLIKIEIAFDIHYVTIQFKVYTQSFFDTVKYIIFRPQTTMACFAMLLFSIIPTLRNNLCTPSAQTLRRERTKGAQQNILCCAPFVLLFGVASGRVARYCCAPPPQKSIHLLNYAITQPFFRSSRGISSTYLLSLFQNDIRVSIVQRIINIQFVNSNIPVPVYVPI